MNEVFRLDHVSKIYKNGGKEFSALKDINLTIEEGEIFGIIGMSGAGKSTLVRTLNRLEDVSSGSVSFYGQDLAELKPPQIRKVRRQIAMIFQSFNLLQQRSVIGAIHYEPFGIYAGKTTDLEDLPDGAIVAVPNNVTNEARALLLLDQEGIITLKEDVGANATVEDISENPKNIQFKELAPEQLVAALPDVDIAVINGNYAIEGGLNVSDALAVEANDGIAAKTYGNIIATTPEKANDPALLALVEVLQSEEISKYITDTYDGALVPLN